MAKVRKIKKSHIRATVRYAAKPSTKKRLKKRFEETMKLFGYPNPAVRRGTKKDLPSKWKTAKVRKVGGKVQILFT